MTKNIQKATDKQRPFLVDAIQYLLYSVGGFFLLFGVVFVLGMFDPGICGSGNCFGSHLFFYAGGVGLLGLVFFLIALEM